MPTHILGNETNGRPAWDVWCTSSIYSKGLGPLLCTILFFLSDLSSSRSFTSLILPWESKAQKHLIIHSHRLSVVLRRRSIPETLNFFSALNQNNRPSSPRQSYSSSRSKHTHMASILENELGEFSIQYWECCQEVFLKQARPELTMTRLSSPLTVPNLCESASKSTHDKTDHLKRKCVEANVKQHGTCKQPLPKRVCLKKCILEKVEVLDDEEIPSCCNKELEEPKLGESKNMYLCEETRQNPLQKGHERVLRQRRSVGNPFYKGGIHTEKPPVSMRALEESA